MPLSPDRFEAALAWLLKQVAGPGPVPDLLSVFPEADASDGYRLQHAWIRRRLDAGETLVGMKVALTNPAMQRFFQVSEPCAGRLTSAAVFPPGPLAIGNWLLANVEPEVGFVIGRRLQGPGVTVADVQAATTGVRPAIEVGHLRSGREPRSLPTVLALNTLNGAVVLGEPVQDPAGLDLAAERVALTLDGEPAGTGSGAEVMGDPWLPVAWLANHLGENGAALEPGMVVISGSMLESPLVRSGQRLKARYDHLGTVAIDFTE